MPSNGLTKEHAESILAQYPSLAGRLEKTIPMPQGMFNENLKLLIEGKAYVLKKMTSGRSIDRHRYGAQLQNILARDGFPCTRVVTNQEGHEISSFEGHLWSVQSWADGGYCSSSQRSGESAVQLMAEVGAAMGTFHALSQTALENGALPSAPDDARLTVSEKMSRIKSDFNYLFNGSFLKPAPATRLKLKPVKSELDKEALTQLSILKEGCRQLLDWNYSAHKSLDALGPCHGDINWENLFFESGKLTAVLDFDNAMEMNQTFDAAAAAAIICADNTQYLDEFIKAYEHSSGRAVERDVFPRLMLLKYIRSLFFQIKLYLGGGTGNDEMARTWRKFLTQNIESQIT